MSGNLTFLGNYATEPPTLNILKLPSYYTEIPDRGLTYRATAECLESHGLMHQTELKRKHLSSQVGNHLCLAAHGWIPTKRRQH